MACNTCCSTSANPFQGCLASRALPDKEQGILHGLLPQLGMAVSVQLSLLAQVLKVGQRLLSGCRSLAALGGMHVGLVHQSLVAVLGIPSPVLGLLQRSTPRVQGCLCVSQGAAQALNVSPSTPGQLDLKTLRRISLAVSLALDTYSPRVVQLL